jgi:S-formylglutathione hydrolase FrmB
MAKSAGGRLYGERIEGMSERPRRGASASKLIWILLIRLGLAACLLFALVSSGMAPARAGASTNLQTLTISSEALGEQTHVNFLLPDGYASSAKRYPVLYLLHGYSGSYSNWMQYTDIAHFVHNLPLIVVMPDGADGWYMDPYVAGQNWETYHIKELIPYVDSHSRTVATRNGRAIAGLSMGGMGAFAYAARHPDLFVAAASFSGVLDPEHCNTPWNGELIPPSQIFSMVCGQSVSCLRAHDPVDLAPNLRGLHLFLSSGNGTPGPLDSGNSRTVDQLEVQIHKSFVSMVAALNSARIPAVVDDYGDGTHSWPYWQRELHKAMPMLLAAVTSPLPPAKTWSFRTADATSTVWGYTLSVQPVNEIGFTDLIGVGPAGFTVSGAGTVTLLTAPIYRAGHAYSITLNESTHMMAKADVYGQLRIVIPLGSTMSTARVGIAYVE